MVSKPREKAASVSFSRSRAARRRSSVTFSTAETATIASARVSGSAKWKPKCTTSKVTTWPPSATHRMAASVRGATELGATRASGVVGARSAVIGRQDGPPGGAAPARPSPSRPLPAVPGPPPEPAGRDTWSKETPMAGPERLRVVVVGAGFAGLACVQALARSPVDIVLVDRRNYHLFQPLLYQVATAALSPADVAWPIRGIVGAQANVRVEMARVVGVDTARRVVLTEGGAGIPYGRAGRAPSELQSLMRISYAVFCLKKKKKKTNKDKLQMIYKD